MKTGTTVLITGCSSGIGRGLAEEFARQGFRVFATARQIETIEILQSEQTEVFALDVTSARSIEAAVGRMMEVMGRIDMLVNNAGFGLMGPACEIPMDGFRRQLETNVVGPLALIQAVVPHMAGQGTGRIVNIGSVSGVLTTPFSGAYCASKAALHALSDALRMELLPFGIEVITVQPGAVSSRFGDSAEKQVRETLRPDSLYKELRSSIEKRAQAGQVNAMDTNRFARQVVRILKQNKVPSLIRLGPLSAQLPLLRWGLPTLATDRILIRKFGLDKLPR